MGTPTLAESLSLEYEEAEELFQTYHDRVPFVKNTYNKAMARARTRGYITTLLGRRRR